MPNWKKHLTLFLRDFAFFVRSAVAEWSDKQVRWSHKAYLTMLQVTQFRPNVENIVFLTFSDENYKQVSPPERTEKRLSGRVVKFTVQSKLYLVNSCWGGTELFKKTRVEGGHD